jgi:hypothetical protein
MDAALGEPRRIEGDVLISFRGRGRARFKVQHGRDDNGQPDDLTWCDVSLISNASIADPKKWIVDSFVPVFLDIVDGDLDVPYRRHKADWLRVLPVDDKDEEARDRCKKYQISITPVQPCQ